MYEKLDLTSKADKKLLLEIEKEEAEKRAAAEDVAPETDIAAPEAENIAPKA